MAGKQMHTHALRKYFGHCMVEKHGIVKAITYCQAIFNHKKPDQTMHYLDVHKGAVLSEVAPLIGA